MRWIWTFRKWRIYIPRTVHTYHLGLLPWAGKVCTVYSGTHLIPREQIPIRGKHQERLIGSYLTQNTILVWGAPIWWGLARNLLWWDMLQSSLKCNGMYRGQVSTQNQVALQLQKSWLSRIQCGATLENLATQRLTGCRKSKTIGVDGY